MLKQYIIIIAAIVILGIAFVFIEKKLSGLGEPGKSTTAIPTGIANTNAMQQFTTSDGRVTISFPSDWYVVETTQSNTSGTFGPYVQTWAVSSYILKDAGSTIPQNGAKIDFDIQKGGSNLPIESLLDCGNKTITCDRVGIDNEQFIKSTATLNTGMRTIGVATFYDQNVLRANATIQTGDKQGANEATVEKILQSISFTTK